MVDFVRLTALTKTRKLISYRVDTEDKVGNVCMHCVHVDSKFVYCEQYHFRVDVQFGTCNSFEKRGGVIRND